MKKALPFLMWLLFALTVFFPAGVTVSACFGCTFTLVNAAAFAILLAVLSVCVVVLDFVFKEPLKGKIIQIMLALLAPLSFLSAVFHSFACSSVPVVAGVFICVVCCCLLTVRHGKPAALKIVALALSGLMLLPVGFFGFLALVFDNIGQNTVTQTAISPDGSYRAEVIDSNQGALGGDTFVDVYEQGAIPAILFKIEKKPQRVYAGDWGEFDTIQLYWKDDGCLVINSTEYEMKP